MKRNYEDISKFIKQYHNDSKTLLAENPSLDNLLIFSPQREGILEWYDFKPGKSLLQIGAECGALTGLFLRCGLSVSTADSKQENEMTQQRYPGEKIHRYDLEITKENDKNCDLLSVIPDKEKFDYIVAEEGVLGSLGFPLKSIVGHLSDTGVLFAMVQNRYGISYFAGTQRSDAALGREKIKSCFEAAGCDLAGMEWYYPTPDFRFPTQIYSDYRLPHKGELTRQLKAYDYPRYTVIDIGERFDEVCEDGVFSMFANSFLIIWSRHE